ncbi:MAG: ABC transporter ATP-binding protein [Cyanobacteria bacterium]|nr:ABC transporter ATP-binding protein [Cyanobacteriota bacterium]
MTQSPANPTATASSPVLEIQELSIRFPLNDKGATQWATAVDQLNLTLYPGQILGLVGESGCGKSLTSLAILKLVPKPGVFEAKTLNFQGKDLLTLNEQAMQQIRGAKIAMIPQDPLTSLNPVYTIGEQLCEVLTHHQHLSRSAAEKKAIALLDQVKLPNAAERLKDYPHQFSGGMRQRVMIAMALSCAPDLLIADEPTTALDVTVQAQILDLLREIQQEEKRAILLITHDLGVVAELCNEVAVMYAGRIVEKAPVDSIFHAAKHPYTQGLLNSLPTLHKKRLDPIEGQPPTLINLPLGCAFEPRCKHRMAHCKTNLPSWTSVSESHQAACFLLDSPSPELANPAAV